MIESFKRFNKNGRSRLDVYTSSKISLDEKDGIYLHNNKSDQELVNALKKVTYCILPSRPDITLCNGTLKIAAEVGCTIIGKFNENLRKFRPFGVHVRNYDSISFENGIKNDFELSDAKLYKNAKDGHKFGMAYSYKITADEMGRVFKRRIEVKNRHN